MKQRLLHTYHEKYFKQVTKGDARILKFWNIDETNFKIRYNLKQNIRIITKGAVLSGRRGGR